MSFLKLSVFCKTQVKKYSSSMKHEMQKYALHKLETGPPTSTTVTKEDTLKYIEDMLIIRRMQQEAANLYKEKLIRGFLHLCSGQEAICVGAKAALKPEDTVITSYRAHGWLYVMGASLLSILAELAGTQAGLSKGKGGSMHMFTSQFYGANGIVGAQVPLGTGIGFAHKYAGTKGVSLTLYGDGAANQGQCFEAFNMAKLWNLPVIFICENNAYGMGTSVARSSASTLYYTRGDYLPGIQINGMDLLAVRETIKFAREYALSKGPIVIELLTYRYFGHSMSDPGTSYRSRDEVQNVRQTSDPITMFKNKALKEKLITEDEVKKLEILVKDKVTEAVIQTKKDKSLDIKEIYYDVYSKNLEDKQRKLVPWNTTEYKNTAKAIKNLK